MKNPRSLSNEALALAADKAIRRLGFHVDRLQIADRDFREALLWSIAVDGEIERRSEGEP